MHIVGQKSIKEIKQMIGILFQRHEDEIQSAYLEQINGTTEKAMTILLPIKFEPDKTGEVAITMSIEYIPKKATESIFRVVYEQS